MTAAGGCAVTDLRVEVQGPSGPTTLIDGAELSVAAGDIVGVVGETGAGKTVTMRALLGLLPPRVTASGSLRVGDGPQIDLADVRAVRALLGRETSVVLQNPVGTLDPLLRVGRQLVEGVVRKRGVDRASATDRALRLLAEMGFVDAEAVLRLHPHQLSGGMAQRVAIAMGMMPQPRLLVLDEPTSALDANVRVEVLKLFRTVAREEGTAVFLVSHDLGLVSHFCDAVAVMYAGRVVERGATETVLSSPEHPYTAALLECSATLGGTPHEPLPAIPGAPPAPGHWPSGCVFEPRCPLAFDRCRAERPALASALDRQDAACHLATTEAAAHVVG
jgi:oligopeptide/dipeptide ABC transporter ATP-binding protein